VLSPLFFILFFWLSRARCFLTSQFSGWRDLSLYEENAFLAFLCRWASLSFSFVFSQHVPFPLPFVNAQDARHPCEVKGSALILMVSGLSLRFRCLPSLRNSDSAQIDLLISVRVAYHFDLTLNLTRRTRSGGLSYLIHSSDGFL
jgi:hypothetical protein